MKPMIKYRGGKSKEIPNIMLHIPRFAGRYIEPFFGGGALFFHLEPRKAIINDINAKLVNFYRGVRDDYPLLRKDLDELEAIYTRNRADFDALKSLHPNERVDDKNEHLYYRIRDMYNGLSEKGFCDAALYYFINKTAYSGMIRYNSHGEFNVPFGRYAHLNTQAVTLKHSRLLQRAEIYNSDFSRIFEMCNEDDFMFLDPPYDCTFSDYGNAQHRDGFDETNHRRLADDYKRLPCKALMVIGKTPLTEELYGEYIVDEYDKNYAVNIRNRFKAAARHIVVANYDVNNDYQPAPVRVREYKIEAEITQLRLFEPEPEYGKN